MNPPEIDKWLVNGGDELFTWLSGYIAKKWHYSNNYQITNFLSNPTKEIAISTIESLSFSDKKREISNMKNAWRAEKCRRKKKTNPNWLNVKLCISAIRRLEKLTKEVGNSNIHQTLEQLILNQYEHNLEKKKEERAANKQAKEDIKIKRKKKELEECLISNIMKKSQLEAIKLVQQQEELTIKYKALLMLTCEFIAKPEDKTLIGQPLTEAQRAEAEKHYNELLSNI